MQGNTLHHFVSIRKWTKGLYYSEGGERPLLTTPRDESATGKRNRGGTKARITTMRKSLTHRKSGEERPRREKDRKRGEGSSARTWGVLGGTSKDETRKKPDKPFRLIISAGGRQPPSHCQTEGGSTGKRRKPSSRERGSGRNISGIKATLWRVVGTGPEPHRIKREISNKEKEVRGSASGVSPAGRKGKEKAARRTKEGGGLTSIAVNCRP